MSELANAKRSAGALSTFVVKKIKNLAPYAETFKTILPDAIILADLQRAETQMVQLKETLDKLKEAVDKIHGLSGLDPDDEEALFKEKYFFNYVKLQDQCADQTDVIIATRAMYDEA
jgi:hypothetical protein